MRRLLPADDLERGPAALAALLVRGLGALADRLEHGVGVEKLNSMCVQFTPQERAQMEALKRAFDPQATLNPGKVVPTLHRCAEYGKMHVKKGLLPFPELPRF